MDLGDGVLFISLRRIAKFALYNTPQPDILFWQGRWRDVEGLASCAWAVGYDVFTPASQVPHPQSHS